MGPLTVITLILAGLVGAAATVITVDWERYAKAFGWTFRRSLLFYGIYVGCGAGASLVFVVAFQYLFGAKPEPGAATWFAGISFGLAGAAAMRADLSRVPEAGDALAAINKLGKWVEKAIDYEIERAVGPRLRRTPRAPFAVWIKYALREYSKDTHVPEAERKATIKRVNGYLDTVADATASDQSKRDARDAAILEVDEWVVKYKLRYPETRKRKGRR